MEIIEFGAEVLRASTMVSKKVGVTSIIIIRLGAEGSLGGSLIVTIIDSVGKFCGKTLRFWRVWRRGEGLMGGVGARKPVDWRALRWRGKSGTLVLPRSPLS